MDIYHLARNFPNEEKYSLTDQIIRLSGSVAANIARVGVKERMKMNSGNILSTPWDRWKKQRYGCFFQEIVVMSPKKFIAGSV